ncbi:MAG: hypothetical protein HRU01_22935 [Myxococcales bacterium]|nr:hypothetical protein [Myxococcales bacterium]
MLLLILRVASFRFALLVHWLHPGVFPEEPPPTPGFLRALGIGFMALIATPSSGSYSPSRSWGWPCASSFSSTARGCSAIRCAEP